MNPSPEHVFFFSDRKNLIGCSQLNTLLHLPVHTATQLSKIHELMAIILVFAEVVNLQIFHLFNKHGAVPCVRHSFRGVG